MTWLSKVLDIQKGFADVTIRVDAVGEVSASDQNLNLAKMLTGKRKGCAML